MATSNKQNVAPVLKTKDGVKGYLTIANGKGKFFNIAELKAKGKDAKKVAQAWYDSNIEDATPAKAESKRTPRKAEAEVVEKDSKRTPRKAEAAEKDSKRTPRKTEEKAESKRTPRKAEAAEKEITTGSVAKGISFCKENGKVTYWRAKIDGKVVARSVKKYGDTEAFLDVVEQYLDSVGPVGFKQDREDDLPLSIGEIRKELKAKKDEIFFA